jgi:hypothetical protein
MFWSCPGAAPRLENSPTVSSVFRFTIAIVPLLKSGQKMNVCSLSGEKATVAH